ncbi:DUF5665 domain-containing protein [Thalassovita taeanensis]|uniref:Uncharacterized protein n=1 Tax=Thalassovita taeanensis TaxID=657014 RepID=A0A1H9C620_9RHOB|nr:DUF5665 domain-containing protein [Thalassovita taeanensis]SEP96283.1 hypothetical protein SAMN04488092_103126 [Thalassovita taeanensis]
MTSSTDSSTEKAIAAIERLTEEVAHLNGHRFVAVQNSLLRQLLAQFTRGLAFGLGSVLGATLLVSVLAWWASQFEFLPLIGDWMAQLADEIERATSGQPQINQITR